MRSNNDDNKFFLRGNFAPIDIEGSYTELKIIQGSVPYELNGSLYRNGPNPRFPNAKLHWFEGDGMLHAITLRAGKASYQNRWIRTDRFNLEQLHKQSLFGSLLDPSFKNRLSKRTDPNVANTNIIEHAGRLLALQETASAIQINKDNLETMGSYHYNNGVPTMSAHPRFDHATGEMLFHSYKPFSKSVTFCIVDKNGMVTHNTSIKTPYSSFMHDFAITQNYVIFPVMPLTFSLTRALRRKTVLIWRKSLDAHFGIMPRYDRTKKIIWFKVPAFYAYHFMNAYEEDNSIILDGMCAAKSGMFPDENGNIITGSDAASYLTRWEFNLSTNKANKFKLDNYNAEFPRFDERLTGLRYRHGYAIGGNNFDSILHYDLQTNITKLRKLNEHQSASEAVFIPKNQNSVEGEGYLLSVVYDNSNQTSVLLILNANQLDQEPIATILLPNRVPNGFHGNWINVS